MIKALRQRRYERPTPEEVLSGSERALLRETTVVLMGVTVVGGILALIWILLDW